MFNVIIALFYLILTYKSGAYKNWREYYSTILYVIIGDLCYNFIFYNHSLWVYDKLISHTFNSFFVYLITFPCMVLIYLTFYPRTMGKKILYLLAFTAGNTLLEFISNITGHIIYYHNWNLYWSIGIYFFMFILIRLHYKHPLITWPISCGFALLTMWIFKIPLDAIK